MRRRARGAWAAASAGVGLAAWISACSSSHDSPCECAEPVVHVIVAPESAAGVAGVDVSGIGCAGANVTCEQEALAGCARYRLSPSAAGVCHVVVRFTVGTTYARDVTIAQASGCCSGLYPTPENAGEIEVTPPPDVAPTDAGEEASANDAAEAGGGDS